MGKIIIIKLSLKKIHSHENYFQVSIILAFQITTFSLYFSRGWGSGEKEGGKEKIEGCEDVRIIDKWESFSGRCGNTRLPEEDCGISSNDFEKQTF